MMCPCGEAIPNYYLFEAKGVCPRCESKIEGITEYFRYSRVIELEARHRLDVERRMREIQAEGGLLE